MATPVAGSWVVLAALGVVAGLTSGLLGVGGGIVIVPGLMLAAGMSQHHAHATSLAAVIPIAAVGAATYWLNDSIAPTIAIGLAAGAVLGAPVGARIMAGSPEATLKLAFGVLLIGMGVWLVWT